MFQASMLQYRVWQRGQYPLIKKLFWGFSGGLIAHASKYVNPVDLRYAPFALTGSHRKGISLRYAPFADLETPKRKHFILKTRFYHTYVVISSTKLSLYESFSYKDSKSVAISFFLKIEIRPFCILLLIYGGMGIQMYRLGDNLFCVMTMHAS